MKNASKSDAVDSFRLCRPPSRPPSRSRHLWARPCPHQAAAGRRREVRQGRAQGGTAAHCGAAQADEGRTRGPAGSSARLEPIELPEFPTNAINFVLDAEGAAAFADLTRSGEVNDIKGSSWGKTFRSSRFVPAVEYIRAQRARTLLNRKMDALMAKYDVFLSPTGSASLSITNLTGHPAACLKAGFVDGTPRALMITGRLYDEANVLRVALACERATKWHTMNPTLDET